MEVTMTSASSKPLLLSAAAKKASSQATPTEPVTKFFRYTIIYPQGTKLPYLTQNAYTRKLNETQIITFADLTKQQATDIKNLLMNVNGKISLNKTHVLDLPKDTETPIATESTSTYANAPVTCAKTKISTDFVMFFPDSLVDKTKFPNVNLTLGPNYTGDPNPCNPHANYTLSTFEQVLGDPSLSITNIAVFTCGGTLTDEVAINALLDILDYAKANPSKKIGMYFAVNPLDSNETLTTVTKELVATGVLVGLAAGNQGYNVCNNNLPPQNVPGTLQIGATEPPGNQCPWWTNWSDIVPNQQYGDCVQAYFPGIFVNKQFNKKIEGTSFAIPQAVAWCMRWWNQHPTATAADAISALQNHTVTITKGHSGKQPYFPPLTPSGQMRVVKTANYCNTNVSSSKPRPN